MRLSKPILCLLRIVIFLLTVAESEERMRMGKIAGTISDASNNQPVVAANIVVVGTQLGTTTNADGHFLITGVTPDTYTLKVSCVG